MNKEEALLCDSAWKGAGTCYKGLIGDIGTVYTIVEIGVQYGYSLFKLALDYPEAFITGFDDFSVPCEPGYNHLMKWLPHFHNVRFHKTDSATAAKKWRDPSNYLDIDILHIDADHSYQSVKSDFEMWEPYVSRGGVIMMHDTQSCLEGPGKFFKELNGRKVEGDTGGAGIGLWFKE